MAQRGQVPDNAIQLEFINIMVEGYNIAFKPNNKTLAGRTQDDLTITPTIKESMTKDDQGNKQSMVIGQEVTFAAQGLVEVSTTGTTSKLTRDDMIELALKTGSSAIIPFVYTCAGGASYSGNCVCTGYTESSNSEDTASWTMNFKVSGAMTKDS